MNFNLYLFDIDNTLFDYTDNQLMPGVEAWFERRNPATPVGFATNQGGVGLRYWMERDGFGEPDKYPTEAEALSRVTSLIQRLPGYAPAWDKAVFVSFAYQSLRAGKWSPVPPDRINDPRWRINWRKPLPGMGEAAVNYFRVTPASTLYVGDDITDAQFARAAGFNFQFSTAFFQTLGGEW